MARLNLEARQTERKNSLVLYIKDAESIVDFLATVGASKALLDFENVRILKSMRNNINRQVNFETANLVKTVDASVRQIETIKQIVDSRGWEGIPRIADPGPITAGVSRFLPEGIGGNDGPAPD